MRGSRAASSYPKWTVFYQKCRDAQRNSRVGLMHRTATRQHTCPWDLDIRLSGRQDSHHKYTQRTGGSQLKKWRETKEKKVGRQKWMEILSSSAVTKEEKAPESQQSGPRRRTNMHMGSQNRGGLCNMQNRQNLYRYVSRACNRHEVPMTTPTCR